MEALDQKYIVELDSIKGAVQSSDLLATYLDDEEDESYQALREHFEPQIEEVYERVASEQPLQLISLEEKLLEPEFEGLYLSRVLGYSVLRGEVDENYKYKRPQDHFKKVLLAICHNINFDLISLRIGQGVQVGFGLSSNIWITNLIEQVDIKRAKTFLKAQVLQKYREVDRRRMAYNKYKRQFANVNYQSAEFPSTPGGLKVLFSSLLQFLMHRVRIQEDNSSLIPSIVEFLDNEKFQNCEEQVQVLHIFANYYDASGKEDWLRDLLNRLRKDYTRFVRDYFSFHEQILRSDLPVRSDQDERMYGFVDGTISDDLSDFYALMHTVHTKGYVHDDTIEAIRGFYDRHEGLSTINECVRLAILSHFERLLNNLTTDAYTDYFDMNKVFAVYMQIFNNEQFNVDLKHLSMAYVAKLLKTYTDKRGRDYQEIKKFVSHTFLDFGFLNEKELVELFKTRRKKRKTA